MATKKPNETMRVGVDVSKIVSVGNSVTRIDQVVDTGIVSSSVAIRDGPLIVWTVAGGTAGTTGRAEVRFSTKFGERYAIDCMFMIGE